MVTRSLFTALGLGMAMTEAVRAGLDRALPGGASVPLRAHQANTRWLEAAFGLAPGTVRSVSVIDEHSGTAARARLAVDSDATEVPGHLFLKFTPHHYSQHVLMNVFGLGAREVLAYHALGERPPVLTPRCYAASVNRFRGRAVVLLEDLSSTARFRTVRDSVTPAEAEAVVDALADLHIAFWETTRFSGDLKALVGRAPAADRLGDLIRRRLLGTMKGQAADLVPESMKRQCRMFFERSRDIDGFWAALPQTLIHADPHLGNLFFKGGSPGLLDWQNAMSGAGIRDVAYFAAASVEPEVLRKIERGLVERYAAWLDAANIRADLDDLWVWYGAAMTEFFLAAVCTAEAGDTMQPFEISRVGVERCVAAVAAHDSFTLLTKLVDAKHA
ncbi:MULTISPECIES: phosphotransferase family protein [Pseudofrankia]|uniref:phosphotransferase family protein n=1 Tax=Pseudofrankia TaxID=2994363 RepID=UPI000234C501|nr:MULTISPECIES: phosphotransferase [Pseudofrankia]